MKRISITILLVAFGIVLAVNGAYATAVNFGASQDAAMRDGLSSDRAMGSTQANWLMSSISDTNVCQGLIQFGVGSIPAGAHIDSATMCLYDSGYYYMHGASIDVYRVTSAWNESTVTYNTRPSHDSSLVSTLAVAAGSTYAYRTWDVTSAVQGWVSGSYANFGLLLTTTTPCVTAPTIASKDYGLASYRPVLTVNYTAAPVPEPGSLMVLGSGVAGLLGLIRRRRQ